MSVLAIEPTPLICFKSGRGLVSDLFFKGEYFTTRVNCLKPVRNYIRFRAIGDDYPNRMSEHLVVKISCLDPFLKLCSILSGWQKYFWIRKMTLWQVTKDSFHSMDVFLAVNFLTKSRYVISTTNYAW